MARKLAPSAPHIGYFPYPQVRPRRRRLSRTAHCIHLTTLRKDIVTVPLPGGPADKYGNRYEDLWTARCLTDLMDESADEIRLEPPGDEGAGAEFWVSRHGRREYHQVKRQNGAEGRWTLGDLNSHDVLGNIWQKLQDPSARFAFVSADGVQYLKELTDRARDAASWQEFDREFVRAQPLRKALDTLRRYWERCSVAHTYEALRRTTVHTIDEKQLRAQVEERIAHLVVCDAPQTVLAAVVQFARDHIHQTLGPHDVWHYAESQPGCQRRHIERDPSILAAITSATDAYATPLRNTLIANEVIARQETEQVLRLLQQTEQSRAVLLTGDAGAGKSHVVLQVVDALRATAWPVLAISSDTLASARRPEDVGEQLLRRQLSPVEALARAAHERPSLLVLDQIDHLSRASGRHSDAYDCFEAILEEAFAIADMRVLLTCREFDLDSDDRLRRLKQRSDRVQLVRLGGLPEAAVRDVVTRMGLDASRLSAKQLDLLSTPLHLYLLEGIAHEIGARVLDFDAVDDLYDRYWTDKQRRIRERRGAHAVAWTEIIDALVTYMSEQQRLSAPVSLLDHFAADADAMTSEHVLILQNKRYAFFHEEFFDYAFARRFSAENRRIVPFLAVDDQPLFRRSQVRHILAFQRHAGPDEQQEYLANLRELLTATGIRFHLKQAALGLLKTVADPRPEEWSILEPLVEGGDETFATEILRALDSSLSWFTLLDRLGAIQRWLTNERFVQKALILLTGVQRILPDRVAELVEQFAEDPDWRARFVWLMNLSEIGASRRFLDLFLYLIDVGALDDARAALAVNGDFWLLVYDLPTEHPDWACEVIGHYLQRRLALSRAADQPNPFDRDTGSVATTVGSEGYLLRAAQAAPAAFVEQVLPFMLEVMALTARRSGAPPWKDAVWTYRYLGGVHGLDHELLNAMVLALRALAENALDEFRSYAQRLQDTNFETAQFLLVSGYAGNSIRCADEAVEYLCGHPSRLALGYLNEPHWATRQLVEAITPHCSPDRLAQLEQTLLTYYPAYERSARGHRQQGRAQLTLLEGIAPGRRSPAVVKRLGELHRKFGETASEEGRPTIRTGWVGAPIAEGAAERLSDAQWLSAIARYNDTEMRTERDGTFVGGADHLAAVLQRQVRPDPVRFAKLLCGFPDTTHAAYFDAVLRGLREESATLNEDLLAAVARHCHQLPGRPCGGELCRLIAKHAERVLSPETLSIVAWYATEDPDPDRELWRTSAPGGGVYYGGDLFNAGINSVRGTAARAIADLIAADGSRVAFFTSTLDHLTRDPSLAVRSCAACAVLAVYRRDPQQGIELFLRLCEAEDDLLKTSPVGAFLHAGVRDHFGALTPLIRRMLASPVPEVASAGARAGCLASLLSEGSGSLAQGCLSGTVAERRGAAQVFAANLRDPGCRGACEVALLQLMDDPEAAVREEVAKCFSDFRAEDVAACRSFIEMFTASAAFASDPFSLLHVVTEMGVDDAPLTCLVCERFLDVAGSALTDIRTYASGYAYRVGEILAQVYRRTDDSAIRVRSLALIERMAQAGVQGMSELMDNLERQ